MVNLYVWLPDIRINVISWTQPWSDLIDWQPVILATQLTIIGLIFPLVLGFVGLLLQNKTANKALWVIYSRYSGFKFVGFSGLLLSSIIVIGQYAHPWGTYLEDVIFSIGISTWFLFNICLLGWFIYATFEFISNDNRNNIILRYCINETLINDIRSRLSELIPQVAIEQGLIPPNDKGEKTPEVTTYYYPRDKDDKHIVTWKHNRYLKNIYFRILSFYVRFWKKYYSLFSDSNTKPQLALPVSGKSRSDKEWTISLSTPPLGKLSKLLIRLGYSFSKASYLNDSNIKTIISALIGNIDDALKENNIRLFQLSIDEMEEWHVRLLSTAAFINDNGEQDNWLLLSDGQSFGGRTLLNVLSEEYYDLSQIAVRKVHETDRYYYKFCQFFLHIYINKENKKLPTQVIRELITSHHDLFTSLLSWKNTNIHDEYLDHQYEGALISFVGSWESWPSWLKLKEDNLEESLQALDHFICHLECSAKQVITALRHEDVAATTWAADILNHWYETVFIGNHPHQFRWRHDFLVHSILRQDANTPIWLHILNDDEINHKDATKLALINSWYDMRILTAMYITNKPIDTLTPEIIKIVMSLIKGDRLKPSGGVGRVHRPTRDGSNILELFIRHSWYWEQSNVSYGSWLDSIVESFGRMEEPRYVIGRVYSGWGSSDVRHLKHSYMVFAILYSQREWALSSTVMEFLFSAVLELNHRESIIRDLKEWLDVPEVVLDKARLFNGANDIDDKIATYKTSISKLIAHLQNQNIVEIINMPVDHGMLEKIGRYASSTGFTLIDGLIPQRLFKDVEYVEESDDSKKSTKIIEIDRQYVTEDADLHGYDNIFDEVVSSDVSINIFRHLINNLPYNKVIKDDPSTLLNNIVVDLQELKEHGRQPVIFIGSNELNRLIDKLLWERVDHIDNPSIEIRRDDGYPDSYICHINNVEAYNLPFYDSDFSILVAKECFKLVEFRRIGDGCYVEAAFAELENKAQRGDLSLSYWLNVNLEMIPGCKYITGDEAK